MSSCFIAIWYSLCGLFIVFIIGLNLRIIYTKRVVFYIKVLDKKGEVIPNLRVYGLVNRYSNLISMAGGYGSQTVYQVDKSSNSVRKTVGITDMNGEIRKTFWLKHFFALQVVENGKIIWEKMLNTQENNQHIITIQIT